MPDVGKTFQGEFTDAASGKTSVDVQRWEATLGGKANGITEVRSSSRVLEDGRLHLQSEYRQNGEWVPGHEIFYVEAPEAEVVFR